MNHTIKQILVNQDKFKTEITTWLKKDFKEQKKELSEIDDKDDKENKEIVKLIKSLKKKFKNLNVSAFVESLMFRSGAKRSKIYYAWWNEDIEEVIIYTYGQKTTTIRGISRPRIRR